LYHYTFLMLIGLTLVLCVRQFWVFIGFYTDFKIFVLFLLLSFFCLFDKAKIFIN
jgi:hypothetical protein